MDLGISPRVAPLLEQVRAYITNEVMPVEHEFLSRLGLGVPGSLPSAKLIFSKR